MKLEVGKLEWQKWGPVLVTGLECGGGMLCVWLRWGCMGF